MTDTKHRYPNSARFSSETACERHGVSGGFPCPWPECENGVPEPSIYEEGHGPTPAETEHLRIEWSFDGEKRFSWKMTDTPAVLEAGDVLASETRRRFPHLAKPVDRVFHYTDINGFVGIVRTGTLWLTDANYMNDRHEIEHGVRIAKEVLSAAVGNATYAASADRLHDTLERLNSEPRPRVCVASVCEDGDNLSQWRAYGTSSSRVALGFEPFVGQFRGHRRYHLRRVVYDQQQQRDWLRMLVHFYHLGLQYDRADPTASWLPHVERDFSKILYNELYEQVVCFKDAAFVDERECRFVYSEDWPAEMDEILRAETLYRVRGRLIVPYVAMSSLASKDTPGAVLPLKDVIVGPQAETELVARGIRDFLESEGHREVDVRQSQVPFRPDL